MLFVHLHNIHSHPRVGYIAYIFVGCEPYTSMLSYVLQFLKLVRLLGYQFAAPSDTIPFTMDGGWPATWLGHGRIRPVSCKNAVVAAFE